MSIVAGIMALVAVGVSAGGAAYLSSEEEKARQEKMAVGKRRFNEQQGEVERQANLGAMGRLKQRRDIAKTATGPAWAGPQSSSAPPPPKGGIESGMTGGTSSTAPATTTSLSGDIVSGLGSLAGATVSAFGAAEQSKMDAKAASELAAMEQEQFDRQQAQFEREGNMKAMDYLAITRDEEKARSLKKNFNSDLYKAWINVGQAKKAA